MVRRLALVASVALLAVAGPAAAARHSRNVATPNPNAGIVNIFTTLGYQSGEAAGTGMVIDKAGDVLTNNHVIRGATNLRVVDVSTNRTYAATVVGYSVKGDVAVLHLTGATNVATIPLGNSAKLTIGQRVVARGNAGGAGGTPKMTIGAITGLHKRIVAQDDTGNSETLTNLVETNASIEPGDSGGPLLNAKGRVIGMITAGTTSFRFRSGGGAGYAIPINKARSLFKKILAGSSNLYIHIGPTAFLGVSIQDMPEGGVGVAQVIAGSAAQAAGLVRGDVITSLDGTTVSTSTDLQNVVLALTPGESVTMQWTDVNGVAQSGQIAPTAGPPQ